MKANRDPNDPRSLVNEPYYTEALHARAEERRLVLDNLCDAAAAYKEEAEREGPAHAGRLTRRRQELELAIDAAHESIHRDINIQDIERVRRKLQQTPDG